MALEKKVFDVNENNIYNMHKSIWINCYWKCDELWNDRRLSSNRKCERKEKHHALSCHCTSIQLEFQLVLAISRSLDLRNQAFHEFKKQTYSLHFAICIWIVGLTFKTHKIKIATEKKKHLARTVINCYSICRQCFDKLFISHNHLNVFPLKTTVNGIQTLLLCDTLQ